MNNIIHTIKSLQKSIAHLYSKQSLPTETVATYSAMQTSITSDPTTKRDFFVSGEGVWYRYDGTNAVRLSSGQSQSAITYAASVTLDFNQADAVRTLALTGNVTFANASNKAAAKEKTVIITADASARTLSFPAWTFIGDSAPTSIAANKTAVLYLYCSGTTEASVIASYSVQP